MIDRHNDLSLVKQCRAVDIARSGIYYEPKPTSEIDLLLMRLIDKIHMNKPFLGVRRIKDALHDLSHTVNRKRVQRNQAWCTDVTYIPMAKGFVYLTVIMDWYSRKILSWRLSNSLDVSFCVDALEEALHRYGKPEIFNSDQGSQYTSEAFTSVLKANGIRISMDGKGAWRDNVFVERLWRSVKYEEVYLNAYESMSHAKQRLGRWVGFYNRERKHQVLKSTPNQKYAIVEKQKKAA